MSGKKKILALFLPLLTLGLVAGAYGMNGNPILSSDSVSQATTHSGTVHVYKNGELVATAHNVLMQGREAISSQIRSGSAVSWDTITLANGTAPNLGDATLASEWASCGLSPKSGSFNTGSAGEWNLTATFDCTCDNVIVNTTAQYSSGATNSYYSGTGFGRDINLYDGDSLEVIWQNDVNSA